MRINEMFGVAGFENEEDDQTVLSLSDIRKTKLTLEQIKKLRAMMDVRKFELAKKKEFVAKQYKPAASEQPPM